MAEKFNGVVEFAKRYQGEYYIHRHASHFYGESNSPIGMFRESRNTFYNQMLNRYQEHFKASVDPRSWEAIALAMRGPQEESKIIKKITEETRKQIQKNLNEAKVSKSFLYALRTARSLKAKDIIKVKDTEALDTLIEEIRRAALLLEEQEKRGSLTLVAILNEFIKRTPTTSRGDIGILRKRLSDKIALMSAKGQILTVKEERIKAVASSLNNLLEKAQNRVLGQRSFDSYLSNIFSTAIGEYILSKGVLFGAQSLEKVIENTLVGAENVKVTKDNELKLLEEFRQSGDTTFKTDNKFDNFNVEVKEVPEGININLGISTKWYKGFFKDDNFEVSLGSEAHFENKLDQTLHAANISKYYAYNAIALKNQNPEGYDALLQMILARNADVFISGLGVGGDFSQFLVINGKFFSVYEILTKLLQAGDAIVGNPVEIELKEESTLNTITNKIEKIRDEYPPSWIKAFSRSREMNPMFKELGLSLHFYLHRLKKII